MGRIWLRFWGRDRACGATIWDERKGSTVWRGLSAPRGSDGGRVPNKLASRERSAEVPARRKAARQREEHDGEGLGRAGAACGGRGLEGGGAASGRGEIEAREAAFVEGSGPLTLPAVKCSKGFLMATLRPGALFSDGAPKTWGPGLVPCLATLRPGALRPGALSDGDPKTWGPATRGSTTGSRGRLRSGTTAGSARPCTRRRRSRQNLRPKPSFFTLKPRVE